MAKKARQIGLLGAVAIGFASMLGAGVFSVFGLAYSNSGSLLLVSLLIAAVVASLNAASIYQLAKRTSRAGGVYSYARVEWNETASFLAGFSFVFGKIGSIAAIGFIFGEYVWPEQSRLVSILAILALALMNSLGINRTALLAGILALVTTTYLLLTGIAGGAFDNDQGQNLLNLVAAPDIQGTLPGAAIIFFAFAGYARVATLGDEVRDAKKNIPRAIVISLVGVLAIYLISAFALTNTLGSALQEANGSFLKMVQLVLPWMPNWVTIFVASIASLGSMLALLAGISRTAATMAEDRELPRIFAQRNRFGAPWFAEVCIAISAIAVLEFANVLPWIIGFSSFSVLLYYAIGHISAYLSSAKQPLWRRLTQLSGFALCVVLIVSVPGPAVWASAIILGFAVLWRGVVRRGVAR